MEKTLKQGILTSICALALACTACTASGKDNAKSSASDTAGPDKQSSEINELDKNDAPVGETMDRQISDAVADLASRTGIAPDKIRIVKANAVNWGSGAVGCPREGMNYTQAIVPGLQVLLEAGGKIHHYHGRTGRSLFFCPPERVEAPAFGRGTEVM